MNDWAPWLGLPLWAWLFVLPLVLAVAALAAGPRAAGPLGPVWRVLDGVYLAAGVVAALFLVAILGLIVAQMVARWTGTAFPGSTNYAGYAMAGASFFALAHALTRGAHIRVSVLLNIGPGVRRWLDLAALAVGAVTATFLARYAVKANGFSAMLNDRTQGQDRVRRWLDLAALAVGAVTATFLARYAVKANGFSAMLNDRTQGQDRVPGWLVGGAGGWEYTPLWLPQLVMSAGAILLAVCLWDLLIRAAVLRRPVIVAEAVE